MKGTIKRRSNGSYALRYDAPPDGSGKRRQINETVRGTKREAEAVLRQRLAAVDVGSFVERNRQTVGRYIEEWLEIISPSITPRTLHGYRGSMKRYLIPALGGVALQHLQAQSVQSLYAELLGRPLSARTVLHVHRILHKGLGDAVRLGILNHNVCDAVTPPRPVRKEMTLWDPSEVAIFLDMAQDSRFRNVYELLLLTGLRRSELAGLMWGSVDLDRATLSVERTLQRIDGKGLVVGAPKTGRSRRSVALSPNAVTLFRKVKTNQLEHRLLIGEGWQNTGYVISDYDGSPSDPTRWTKDFTRLVKRSGLPHLTLHGLRHMHASLMLVGGVHLKVVSERLGHSNIAMTADTYSHLLPGLQESAALILDNVLSGAAS